MNLFQVRILLAAALSLFLVFIIGSIFSGITPTDIAHHASGTTTNGEKLAYMTFLAGTSANRSDPDIMNDRYFVAARMLGYQLMHQESTRTQEKIPYVVLVTDDVNPEKRERLKKDGATVIPVRYLHADWLKGREARWASVMAKLRAWDLTQYSRALFIDADTIINRRLDDVFKDPGAQFQSIRPEEPAKIDEEEALKADYLFASIPQTKPDHKFPPLDSDYDSKNYFNAGFFVFAPSPEMSRIYTALMGKKGLFDATYPEQNLLNFAHRRGGKAPWAMIDAKWNVNFPSMSDVELGAASMHEKWFNKKPGKENLKAYTEGIRYRMMGFYEGRESKAVY